ncbi:MAG: 6-phosphogluconolactonase [Actinomycetota bacterium]
MADDLHILDITPTKRWALRCADVLEASIAQAVDRFDLCTLALSGGSTPGPVFESLAERELPWERVTILQVDERLAPAEDPARNLAAQQAALGDVGASWLPLPVDELLAIADPEELFEPTHEAEVKAVLDRFRVRLIDLAGDPPILNVVHLGLGDDGHTASLVPGDPLLTELRAYVGVTEPYNGHRRLSLTRPVLDRARMVVWLVSGASKAEPLGRLLAGDMSIPAGLIMPAHSVVLADEDAARQA